MSNLPLYNSIIIKAYVDFLENSYPNVNIKDLLEYSRITTCELEDRGHWLIQEQVNRFQEYVERVTANPKIAREAGKHIASTKSFSIIRQTVARFLSPSIAYWAVEKLGSTISRHQKMKVNKLANNKVEIIATPNPGVKEEPFQCENRIGMFEVIAEVFTHKYANIEHPECIHKGDKHCKYIISWRISPALIWKKVSLFLFLSTIVISIFFLHFQSFINLLIFLLFSILICGGIYLYATVVQVREMTVNLEDQGKTSDELFEQIDLRYNELLLVREIGEAASSILEPEILFNIIIDSLQKHLQFSRGMIMLSSPDNTKLLYVAGYGYGIHESSLLNEVYFNINNPHSKGVFYLAYHEQKPFIINDSKEIQNNLSEKSMKFIKDFNVNSFVCVPIVYEGKSEGVLAVDNKKNKLAPTQSDLSLLTGIAHQIGISLNNAQTHKKVLESEERFRNLSNNSPDIIYQVNSSGNITYVNPAWKELLGHDLLDVINRNLADFVRQEEKETLVQTLQDIIKKMITLRDINFIFLNNKDLPRHITLTGAPDIDSDGKVIGIIGTLKDISRMRGMEAQLLQTSKMEALGSLTGGVAHDFNNIIQAIMGYNQIMMTGRKDSATQKKYHQNIQELISRSRELIQQLLFYGRKSDTKLKSIIINSHILNTINLLSKSISKTINIQNRLADDLLPVLADSNLIGQIIMNLVINARDAMGDSGTISIYTNNLTQNNADYLSNINVPLGNYVRLIVTDTGCGMDKDTLIHIFDPFFTTKEVGKGTGLGLSVVKQIVQSLNGYISCDSIPNKGTTFEILLPAADKEIEVASQAEQPVELKHGKEKLLIVDDESYVLETVKDTLSSYGYKILTANSIDEALKTYSAKKDKIKLVLLDLNMPGSGGKKCLLDILAINKSAKILMTSGYTTKAQIDDLIDTGASGFIIKPYRTEELLVSIRNILDSRVN